MKRWPLGNERLSAMESNELATGQYHLTDSTTDTSGRGNHLGPGAVLGRPIIHLNGLQSNSDLRIAVVSLAQVIRSLGVPSPFTLLPGSPTPRTSDGETRVGGVTSRLSDLNDLAYPTTSPNVLPELDRGYFQNA